MNAIVALLISCYGLYLRFRCLAGRELWNDEAYQYHCMQGAFKPFWLHQQYGDLSAFPGEYYLNYFFVQWFGMNKWGLAIPHIIITIIGFVLLYKLGQYYFHSWVGYFVAFAVLAFNKPLIFHSFEFRPYGVLPVLALASLYFSHRVNDQSVSWSKVKTFLLGLLTVITINYHAYGLTICFLPLIYVALVHFKNRPGTRFLNNKINKGEALTLSFFVLASLLLWVWYAASNKLGLAPTVKVHWVKNIFEYIANPAQKPWAFLKSVVGDLVGNRWEYPFLLSMVVVPFLPVRQKFEQFVFVAILIILPVALILNVDLRIYYWFLDRQFEWVVPFAGLFLGWQWDAIYCLVQQKGKRG